MTHHNDPNMNRHPDLGTRSARDGNIMGWVLGGVAAIALIAVGLYAFSGDSSRMAQDVERPVVTAPAATTSATTGSAPTTTTGSGAATTGSGTARPPVNR